MPKRKKDKDLIVPMVQLVGLLFLLGILSPQFRNMASNIGMIIASVLGIVFVCAIGFLIFQVYSQSKSREQQERNVDMAKLEVNTRPTQPSSTELLEQIRAIDWFQFEKLVELVYRKKGFEVQRKGGANPDGGIDVLIEKDGQQTAIQCKQWKTWNVGVKVIREFVGALKVARIERGIFITLRGYTGDAKQLADEQGIEILNETSLLKLLEEVDAGSDPHVLALLNDKRKFCPKCECEMQQKVARRGRNAGKSFWACPAFPKCDGKLAIN